MLLEPPYYRLYIVLIRYVRYESIFSALGTINARIKLVYYVFCRALELSNIIALVTLKLVFTTMFMCCKQYGYFSARTRFTCTRRPNLKIEQQLFLVGRPYNPRLHVTLIRRILTVLLSVKTVKCIEHVLFRSSLLSL